MRRALHYGAARTRPLGRRAAVREGGGSSLLDLSALSWNMLHMSSYGGSPWAGDASAGNSGSHDLSEATNPPAVGTAQGGYTPADFQASDELTATGTLGTYASATTVCGAFVVLADTITGSVAQPYANDTIACTETSAYFAVALHNAPKAQIYIFDGGDKIAEVSSGVAAGSYIYIHFRIASGSMKIGCGGTWGTATAVGSISSLANNLRLGLNYNGTAEFDGRILFAGMSKTDFGDDVLANQIRLSLGNRFGLSL